MATMTPTALAALTSTQRGLWWGAIIGGFVVVLAVAALLTILVLLVRTIDRRVVLIKASLTSAAANTADTALIAQTAAGVDAVLAEGLEHHLFLGRVLAKVRM
jgi:Ca2+/Na+ antiporter